MWWKYVLMHENGKMRPVIFHEGSGDRRMMEMVGLAKIHCHNVL
jgi:hypothetical protein